MSSKGKHRKGFWQAAVVGSFTIGLGVGAVSTSVGFVAAEAAEQPSVSVPSVVFPMSAEAKAKMIGERERLVVAASRDLERAKIKHRERVQAREARQEARREAREAAVVTAPAPLAYPVSGNRAIGQELMSARWGMDQWPCLDELWSRESSWNHLAENPSSGAYGIPQSLPGDKMASAGDDWATNPATQIQWGLGYIAGRYGSPCNALAFHDGNNWY